MYDVLMQSVCHTCHLAMQPSWYFCPNCGKQLNEPPLVISIPKQIGVYLVSFFLSPLGLGWAMKYIKHPDRKVRVVGFISLFLTFLALDLTLFYVNKMMQSYSSMLNGVGRGVYPGMSF